MSYFPFDQLRATSLPLRPPPVDPALVQQLGLRLSRSADHLRGTAADLRAGAGGLGWRSPAATGFDTALAALLAEFRHLAGRVDDTGQATIRHARRAADRTAELARAAHLAGLPSRAGLASLAGAAPLGSVLALGGFDRLAGEAGRLLRR